VHILIFLRKILVKLAKKGQKQPLISHFDDNFPYYTPPCFESFIQTNPSFQGVQSSNFNINPGNVPTVATILHTESEINMQFTQGNSLHSWTIGEVIPGNRLDANIAQKIIRVAALVTAGVILYRKIRK